MSEYWKSTPKYWCKHCKTHVRDTPLERRNHESTPKHQGALSRFLKDLHRTNEREARDAKRAKEEAARLNGLAIPTVPSSASSLKSTSGAITQMRATPEDRRRQLSQLAALGVAVPEEFRRENAMAGEWEALPQEPAATSFPRRVPDMKVKTKLEEPEDAILDSLENNSVNGMVSWTKKRAIFESDDEHKRLKPKRRPNWGGDIRAYRSGKDDELETLLDSTAVMRRSSKEDCDEVASEAAGSTGVDKDKLNQGQAEIEKSAQAREFDEHVPTGEDLDDIGSIFRKRKPKAKS